MTEPKATVWLLWELDILTDISTLLELFGDRLDGQDSVPLHDYSMPGGILKRIQQGLWSQTARNEFTRVDSYITTLTVEPRRRDFRFKLELMEIT